MVDISLLAQAEGASAPAWPWRSLRAHVAKRDIPITLISALGLLLAWALVTKFKLVAPLFLPSPLDVATQFYTVAVDGGGTFEVSYALATDMDLRAVLPIESP